MQKRQAAESMRLATAMSCIERWCMLGGQRASVASVHVGKVAARRLIFVEKCLAPPIASKRISITRRCK